MDIRFTKMNGEGNDFVALDNLFGGFLLDGSAIDGLCDRHRGVETPWRYILAMALLGLGRCVSFFPEGKGKKGWVLLSMSMAALRIISAIRGNPFSYRSFNGCILFGCASGHGWCSV